ncbi:MAG: hypothetical protein Q9219_001835 [cf. Caloplaca sp. 3 TL-2023]
MFNAFADAEQRAVPEVRKTRVSVDNDGEDVVSGSKSTGTGYSEYAAAVVRTIKKERRGLDNDRYRENRRRKEDGGRVVDMVDNRDDASGGIKSEAPAAARCSSFRRFRRLCGSSGKPPQRVPPLDWSGTGNLSYAS